jgi:hypothetical protein
MIPEAEEKDERIQEREPCSIRHRISCCVDDKIPIQDTERESGAEVERTDPAGMRSARNKNSKGKRREGSRTSFDIDTAEVVPEQNHAVSERQEFQDAAG